MKFIMEWKIEIEWWKKEGLEMMLHPQNALHVNFCEFLEGFMTGNSLSYLQLTHGFAVDVRPITCRLFLCLSELRRAYED